MKTDLRPVLELVNKLRAAFGHPELDALPRGIRGKIADCPLARSIAGLVPGHQTTVGDKHFFIKGGTAADRRLLAERSSEIIGVNFTVEPDMVCLVLPTIWEEFVPRFDRGGYPELVEDEEDPGE
ncbi:hypothetical protein HYS30_00300 [Candidatus Peregrinibacteria bacterium]|nr:hypothetical protein [Candidatus Peregrinibacteria bacterium]